MHQVSLTSRLLAMGAEPRPLPPDVIESAVRRIGGLDHVFSAQEQPLSAIGGLILSCLCLGNDRYGLLLRQDSDGSYRLQLTDYTSFDMATPPSHGPIRRTIRNLDQATAWRVTVEVLVADDPLAFDVDRFCASPGLPASAKGGQDAS